jgi:hypothetical protein
MLGWRLQAIMRKPATRRACAGTNRRTNKAIKGGTHDGCGQAFLFTGELFLLSFAAIFVIWFADRLRRNFIGKP